MTSADSDRVVVVGAGPVGLSAALGLRAHGLPVVVLEADPEDRQRPGSRALFVHRETLRLLDGMRPGLAVEFASYGRTWHTRRTLYRGREVYSRTFPEQPKAPTATPPFTSLRQVDTERFLRAACRDAGVEFAWGVRVTGVRPSPTGVALTDSDGGVWHGTHASPPTAPVPPCGRSWGSPWRARARRGSMWSWTSPTSPAPNSPWSASSTTNTRAWAAEA